MALRIAVVGVGFGTTVHLPALKSEGLEVVAIGSRRRERAEAAAEQFGVESIYTDYDELLAMPGLDAVSIATPPILHREMAIAALQAGKHVLCEKPFALNIHEAKEMLDAAEHFQLTAMVAHEFRFSSGRMLVKELLDTGYLGTPRLAVVKMIRGATRPAADAPAELNESRDIAALGGGLLFALGSHFIDGLRHWFGDVSEVSGSVMTASPERLRNGERVLADADDSFVCTLQFANGMLAEVVATWAAAFGSESTIAVYGSKGMLETPQRSFNPPAHGTVLGAQLGSDAAPAALPVPERLEPFVDDRDDRLMPFRLLVREFCRGVEEGTSPSPNFLDGYRCQQVLDAVRSASATGRRVSIPA